MSKKRFMVTRYEIHEYPILVDAEDALDAIERANNGEGDPPEDVSKWVAYVAIDEDRGMALDELLQQHPQLDENRAMSSRELNSDGFFPTICSVTEVEE